MVKSTTKSASSSSTSTKSEQPVGTENPSANPASDGSDKTTPKVMDYETRTVEVEARVPVERSTDKPKSHTEDQTFVIPQTTDPRRNIPGTSQYLDEVERRNVEIVRAKAEEREPDLENPPAFQGTPLYTEAQAKQQGLDVSGDAVQKVELPVTVADVDEVDAAAINYDAYNGAGATVLVNSGVPRG